MELIYVMCGDGEDIIIFISEACSRKIISLGLDCVVTNPVP